MKRALFARFLFGERLIDLNSYSSLHNIYYPKQKM